MSATSALESNEDLENVPLVRMEDVQPDRFEMYIVKKEDSQVMSVEYKKDPNIWRATIRSEETVDIEESDCSEMIVPDTLPTKKPIPFKPKARHNPDNWPTLEILPGGVIKNVEKHDNDISSLYESSHSETDNEDEDEDLMYACAKCSQRFKFLFCLVNHVKWHEEQKKGVTSDISRQNADGKKNMWVRSQRRVTSKLKTKCKVPKKL